MEVQSLRNSMNDVDQKDMQVLEVHFGVPYHYLSVREFSELSLDIERVIVDIPVEIISIVIDKKAYWKKYPAQNPYNIAYLFLLERFQKFLEENENAFGLCIIDPGEGQVDKAFIGDPLKKVHHAMRWKDGSLWNKCPNIVERLLYSDSEDTIGIQIADLYCYPVFHIFEYNKQPSEYWRYQNITLKKFRRVEDDHVGLGLKVFPWSVENIKKEPL